MAILHELGLEHAADERAINLPYGDQRRLEIARALATRPRLLLLDEPAAGMNPARRPSVPRRGVLRARRGLTILLIEHDMRVVMGISERISHALRGRSPKARRRRSAEPEGDRGLSRRGPASLMAANASRRG